MSRTSKLNLSNKVDANHLTLEESSRKQKGFKYLTRHSSQNLSQRNVVELPLKLQTCYYRYKSNLR